MLPKTVLYCPWKQPEGSKSLSICELEKPTENAEAFRKYTSCIFTEKHYITNLFILQNLLKIATVFPNF